MSDEIDRTVSDIAARTLRAMYEMAERLIEQAIADGYRGPVFVWWEMPTVDQPTTARVRGARALPIGVPDDTRVRRWDVTDEAVAAYRATKGI